MLIKTIASVFLLSLDPSEENVPMEVENYSDEDWKETEDATRRMYASGSGLQKKSNIELKNSTSVSPLLTLPKKMSPWK